MKFDAVLIHQKNRLINDLLLAMIVSIAFSSFIYFAHWEVSAALVDTMFGLSALYGLLTLPKRSLLFAGFFIGLLWFYWIGYSFEYYGMKWAIPLITLGFGLVYTLFFGVMALTQKPWLRGLILFILTFIEPFDFNWMQPELIFINSYLGIEKWQFALILIALTLFASMPHPRRLAALLLLLGAIEYSNAHQPILPLSIKLVATDLPQELKWQPGMRSSIIASNMRSIDDAIQESHDLVILPESAFPLYLNLNPELIERLQERSHAITIVTGALLRENGQNYNVTYIFSEGEFQIAKKMVLVPFGEYIPLPRFAREWVNNTFFGGASDYHHAQSPTDLDINGTHFRNAICYEATCHELYTGHPAFMIAISNNAWFMPSIEPTLQRLLMQFYANKYGTAIFHSANAAGTGIVYPFMR